MSFLTGDYQGALTSLTESARQALSIRRDRDRHEALARAGYWASRALEAQGRLDEAASMRQATTAQKGTFYALLVDVQQSLPGRGILSGALDALHRPEGLEGDGVGDHP